MIRSIPKNKPFRSESKRAFVRSLPCEDCGWPAHLGEIQCHHVKTGGMGTKIGDEWTVPLCSPNARCCHARADKTPASVEKYLERAKEIHQQWLDQTGRSIKE